MTAAAFLRRGAVVTWLCALAAAGLPGSGGPHPGSAQEVEREVQVPLDSVRAIVEVSPELRRQLGLFPEVEDFVVARLFVTADGREILEVSFREDGRLVRERRVLTGGDLAELRGRIGARLADQGMGRAVEREARGGLVLAETALGLGFYGWAVPEILGVESDRGRVAAYLLTAGASFVVPYFLTDDLPVREAHRDAVVWGGTRGIAYGLLLGDALTGGDEHPSDFVEGEEGDTDHRVVLGTAMLTSLAAQVLGYHAVEATDATRGTVALWSTVGDLSLAYGFGASYVAGLYDGDPVCDSADPRAPEPPVGGGPPVCYEDDFRRTPAGHAGTMALGLAGLWAAKRWGDAEDYTVGDARALLSAGVLGAQVALPVAWALFEDDENGGGEKPFVASLVAGSVGGLWLANRGLRRHALTPGDGLLVQAGHVAGGLVAGGLTYLADSGETGDELVYFTTTALGSLAGAWLTFRAVAGGDGGTAREARKGSPASGGVGFYPPPPRGGPTVEVGALAVAPLLLDRLGGKGNGRSGRTRLPLVTVRW